MSNFRSYVLATVGIVGLAAALALNIVRANNSETQTGVSATAHFKVGGTYLLFPVNGSGTITCKVAEIDAAWLKCEEQNNWVNTNAIISARDAK